jgi:hypothetical protein
MYAPSVAFCLFMGKSPKRQTNLDRHSPRPIANVCHFPGPPFFSLQTTFIFFFYISAKSLHHHILDQGENEEKTWDGAPLPPAAPPLPDLQQRGSWPVISGPASTRGQHRARHRIRGWIPRCVKTPTVKKVIAFPFPSRPVCH